MLKNFESIRANTGEQEYIQVIIDRFFEEVYEEILKREKLSRGYGLHPYFEICSGNISKMPSVCSDDRVTYFKYKENVVAIVMETRTNLNQVQYDFFCNLE